MDDHQIHVPSSFQDLFRQPGRSRLSEPWHHILARYEVCEDLAQGLCPQARALRADLGVTGQDIALRMESVLAHPAVGLAPEERLWVRTRLAELIDQAF